MKKQPNYVISIRSSVLHELLTRVAQRAYEAGHKDGVMGKDSVIERVRIDPQLLRKFA